MKDRYAQVYAQIERETERYLHENTLCDGDIDRYGFGKHILRLLMSGLAMHAMGGLMGGTAAKGGSAAQSQSSPTSQPAKSPAAQKQSPAKQNAGSQNQSEPQHDDPADIERENQERDKKLHEEGKPGLQQRLLNRQKKPRAGSVAGNLDFEKLHPRGQSQNAGQFAEKPGGDVGSTKLNTTGIVQPPQLPRNATPEQMLQHLQKVQESVAARSKTASQNLSTPMRPQQQLDPITAAVAEKWHGDKQEPAVESPRNYPDNLNKPPEQQTPYAQQERTIEPTDDDLTAMKEDPYNYDPEQGAGPAQAQEAAPAPPQAEAQQRMTRMFTKKNWSAGMNQGSIGFQDEEHAAMHELGSKLRNQLSGHNSLRPGAKQPPNMERANKLAAEYARKHGVDPAEIQTHASAVYRNDKAVMKGIADGEHRDVPYSGFKKPESQKPTPAPQARASTFDDDEFTTPAPQAEAPPTQSQPNEDARAQQQAEARAKRNAEHAAKVAAEKAAKPSRAEQKAAEKRVEFDPSEWENEPEDEPAPIAKVKTKDYTKKDSTGKVVEQDLVARDEARAKRANAVRSARRKLNSTAEERGEQNIAEMSENHGLHHDSFSQHVKAMESHEGGLWDAKEKAKTQIRKAWGVTSRDLEKLADKDHTSLEAQDNLSGNVENIHEHLGSDPHYWGQNAWDMLREDTPERPGVHNKEWLEHHAKQFKEMSNNQPQYDNHQDYEEPPDGAPFSRKALTAEIDRYFNEARIQYRKQRQTAASAIWTDKDRWL